MMAVSNAVTSIRAREARLVLAGGIESMSRAGFFLSHRARWGYKLLAGAAGEPLTDLLVHDGLTDATTGEGMGVQVDRLCVDRGVSRAELDEIAALSHQRAAIATEKGRFSREIVPIETVGKTGTATIATDEGIRPDSTPEGLGKLRPAFNPEGMLTAGNSSQISDGAAAVLLAGREAVDEYGLQPMARVLGGACVGGETARFPEIPAFAVKKLLASLGRSLADFDLVENNEAFALNNLLFERDLALSREKQNVNGGAIALGHPIGASGARVIVTLLNALTVLDKTLGLAAICHGTGGGTAIAFERI
jgi:acetyl-CoA C-acetyltransferase